MPLWQARSSSSPISAAAALEDASRDALLRVLRLEQPSWLIGNNFLSRRANDLVKLGRNLINRRKLRCCFAFLFWPSETWKRVNILLPFSILSMHLSIYLEDCERHDMLKIPDKSSWNYFHFKHPKHPNNCDKR